MFPILIMALVPARQYILPSFFKSEYLQQLDAAEYEEAIALPFNSAVAVRSSSACKFNGKAVLLWQHGKKVNFYFISSSLQGAEAHGLGKVDITLDAEVVDEEAMDKVSVTSSRGEVRHSNTYSGI
jgi:hypothetical protein